MDRKTWNELVTDHAPLFGAFLQSWEWGEFQRTMGRQVERVFAESDDGNVIAQAVKLDVPFGQYFWFLPKGPLGTAPIEKKIGLLRDRLTDGIFYRLEPGEASRMMKVKDVHPSTTLLLDLNKDENELLAQMKSKTRYNIRLAQRKGVICKFVGMEHFDDFMRLAEQTAKRDKIRFYPAVFYKTMLEALSGGDLRATLACAFYEDRPVSANILVDFDGVRTYLHGATSNLHRNVMAQYALHWFLASDAKQKGFHTFDFGGITPVSAPSGHSWAGVTRYKKGYGGEVVSMPGTFELPTKAIWYSLYRMAKMIRK